MNIEMHKDLSQGTKKTCIYIYFPHWKCLRQNEIFSVMVLSKRFSVFLIIFVSPLGQDT